MSVSMTYGGKRRPAVLNPDLIVSQGIGPDEVAALEASHVERAALFDRMDVAPESELLALAQEFDQLEFRQQELWRSRQDALHHYWFTVPRCTCCKSTNQRLYGVSPFRAIQPGCPIHGQLLLANGEAGPDVVVVEPEAYVGTAYLWVPTEPNRVGRPAGHRFVDTRDPIQGRALLEFRRPGDLGSQLPG